MRPGVWKKVVSKVRRPWRISCRESLSHHQQNGYPGYLRYPKSVPRSVELVGNRICTYLGSYTGQPSVHIVLEEADKALKKAEDLLENPGATSHTYNYLKAMKLRRQLWMGNYGDVDMEREMEQAFQQAIKLNPSETLPYISFSNYYMKKHEVRKAEDLMRQALKRDPLHLNALQFYSRVLSMQGKFDESLQWAKRVVEYYQEGYHIVSRRYEEIDRFGEAISWILQTNYQLHLYGNDVANNYMALGDRENARYWKEKKWMISDEKELSKLDQAYVLMFEGKYDAAYELADEAVTESDATEWYVLNEPAEWAMLAGRYADAIRYYERAFPNLRDPLRPDVNILNMGGALDLAFALNQSGEEGRAGILFGLILNLVENKNRIGHNSFGITDVYIYASLGQSDRALKALREAIDAGWRGLYATSTGRMSPMLNSLRDNPDFESMVAEVDADLSAQRQRLAEKLAKEQPKS